MSFRGGAEKRGAPRYRTRLRPGKLFDPKNNYLADCALYDLSATGARVRLFNNRPLPIRLRLFDEREMTTKDANIAWRDNREIGLRFL